MQVVSGEWVLGIQVQEFEILFNFEIRNGEYCCCDIPPPEVECSSDLTALDSDACNSVCLSYLETRVEVCFSNLTCLVMEDEHVPLNSNVSTSCSTPFRRVHI